MAKRATPAAGDARPRCGWAEHAAALDREYHDVEWGVPHRRDRELFELLCLEGAQAGLSWSLILSRRLAFRKAFAGFDPAVVARFGDSEIEALVGDASIIRHRGKITSVVRNARVVEEMRAEGLPFADYVWSFTDGVPLQPNHARAADIPVTTDLAKAFSADLRKRGFGFVGPTVVYSFMQATGMTNDHVTSCYRHAELSG